MPGAPSSVLAPSSNALVTSSVLVTTSKAPVTTSDAPVPSSVSELRKSLLNSGPCGGDFHSWLSSRQDFCLLESGANLCKLFSYEIKQNSVHCCFNLLFLY